MVAICQLLKRLPGSPNELFDPTRVLDTFGLDAAADVDSERTHLPNRRTNVVRIQSAREDNWKGGANLSGEPPIGTNSGPARGLLRKAVN